MIDISKLTPFEPDGLDRCEWCGGKVGPMYLIPDGTPDDEFDEICHACATTPDVPPMNDEEWREFVARIPTTAILPDADWE